MNIYATNNMKDLLHKSFEERNILKASWVSQFPKQKQFSNSKLFFFLVSEGMPIFYGFLLINLIFYTLSVLEFPSVFRLCIFVLVPAFSDQRMSCLLNYRKHSSLGGHFDPLAVHQRHLL